MKVLHLANVGGEKRGGGVHEVAYNFYQYQQALGIVPSLWFPGNEEERFFYMEDDGIKVLPTFGSPNFGILKELLFQKNSLDFDILHQHGIWLPTSMLSKRYRRENMRPHIIQPHGYLEPFRLTLSKYKKRLAYYLFEKENIKNADLLIACSEQESINLKKMFPNKQIATIANGIPKEFIENNGIIPCIDNSDSSKFKMLFLSRIHPLKGLERFLKVIHKIGVSKFKDWTLIIAGFQEVNHETYLKKLVNELGLVNFVSFVGPKFGQDKIDLLSCCDLFVLPTFNENFGIVIAEALGRGIPVLTTKGTPWAELETYKCGWWVNNDEFGLHDALIEILKTEKTTFKSMGERGKQLILSKYTWEATTKSTIELYNWLIYNENKPSFII